MASPLKILLLEDDPIDAEIVQWTLKDAFSCIFQVAANKEAYFLALEDFKPDVILADNAIPRFSAREALEGLTAHSSGIPFILVTGTVSEEFAAGIIRLGADDYILKDRLARLPSAIGAALHRKKSEAERKKGEEKLRRSYEEIRRLASHLQDVREEERLIIAREIHDQLGQQLTIMKMDIGWLMKKLPLDDNAAAKEKLEELNSMMEETIKTVRKIAADLRPGLLDDLGLGAAIEWHINEFEKRTGIDVDYAALNDEVNLSMAAKTGLFRIVQEALTNVARYAQAKNVEVRLLKDNKQLSLIIRDDGVGFDQEKIYAKKTFGIVGMRERTAMMGGNYSIESTPGNGTTITVQIPLIPKFVSKD